MLVNECISSILNPKGLRHPTIGEWQKNISIKINEGKNKELYLELLKEYKIIIQEEKKEFIIALIYAVMIYQIPYIFHIYTGSKKHPRRKEVTDIFNFQYSQYNSLISRKMEISQAPNILAMKYIYLILLIFVKKGKHLKQLAFKLVDDLCGMGDMDIIDVDKYLKEITLKQGNYKNTFDQLIGKPVVKDFTEVEIEQFKLLIAVRESEYYQKLFKFMCRKYQTLRKINQYK